MWLGMAGEAWCGEALPGVKGLGTTRQAWREVFGLGMGRRDKAVSAGCGLKGLG